MAIELFDRYNPADIFGMIDNQSVSREMGERMIKRYGDRRALEAVMEYQKTQGIELGKEIEDRILRTGKLLDELYKKIEAALNMTSPYKKRGKESGKHRAKRLKCLGNSVVPQIPQLIIEELKEEFYNDQ
jgi:hypothetical protein